MAGSTTMANSTKTIILSGLRPTGLLHIGNYFGALLPLVKLQDQVDDFYIMIADIHALTTLENSKNLKQNSLDLAMTFLAAGIDPNKSKIFIQSQIPEHSELANFFSMVTPIPILELNPTYKEMREEHPQNNNLGLLAYPVLQAADILVYKATHVPVGKDQAPHIEITREIARKFNNRFGNVFPEPKTVLQKESKIFSLQDPSKKMSKSHGENSYIGLLDSPDKIREKIKTAVTDSGKEVIFDEKNKPAISNLLTIYNLFSEESIKDIEEKYKEKSYSEFKKDLAEVIIVGLEPLQQKYNELKKDENHVIEILKNGAIQARQTASQTIDEVKNKIGFLN